MLFLRKCWTSIVNLLVIAYLARTLSLEAFGIVPVCTTILSVIQILAVSGISEYVIFYNGRKEDRDEVINAAFWLNLVASLGVVAVCIPLAPAIANHHEDPVMGPVILVMLGGFFSSMVASIPKALYRKEINYGPLVALETVQQTTVCIGQVVLAWQGFGVFSLVLPTAIVNPFIALIFLWKSPLKLRGGMGFRHWSRIFAYTRHIIVARLLTRLGNEGDNLIVANVLGLADAGRYNLAYRMANILFLSLTPVVVDVSMPVFARISEDRRRLFVHYVKMLSLIMFVMFPVLLIVYVNASEISMLIYEKDLGLLVQILMISVLGRCISSPTGGLFNATGKPQIALRFVSVFAPSFLGTLYFTSRFGLIEAAMTVAGFFTVGQIVQTWLASRFVFDMPLGRIMSRIWPYALPSALAGAITLAARMFVTTDDLILHTLIVSTIFGACYVVLFRWLAAKEVVRITRLFEAIHPKLGNAARILSWPRAGKLASESR